MTLTTEAVLLSLASALLSGLIVAAVTNWLTRKREQAAKNREIVLTKLVRAWELLDDASQIGPQLPKYENFSEIIQILQLHGDLEEFEMIDRITKEIVALKNNPNGWVSWGDLQKKLRDRIRSELGLPEIEQVHLAFRTFKEEQTQKSVVP